MSSYRALVRRATILILIVLAQAKSLRRPGHTTRFVRAVMLGGGSYRVRLPTPLGIGFEECTPNAREGVTVSELVEGGNAERDGRVLVGDRLLKCSAVTFGGEGALLTVGAGRQFTSWSRELIPCAQLDFEMIMAAIGSNSGR